MFYVQYLLVGGLVSALCVVVDWGGSGVIYRRMLVRSVPFLLGEWAFSLYV